MNTTTELQRPVEAGHDILITPTASARKELPPERYQITRGAVINQVAYHVACHNALLRAAERAKVGTRMRILNDAEKELQNAERCINELESLASDEDVDYVLAYLQRVHHWEPRDIRPKKMERTPRQVRAGHKLPTAPPKAEAFKREVLYPGHGLGKGASTYDAPMPKELDIISPIHLQDKKNNFELRVKLAAEGDYYVGALDFNFGRADSKNGGYGMYCPTHRINGEFKSEVHAFTYFVEEAIERLLDLPKQYPKALPQELVDKTMAFLMEQRANGLERLARDPFTFGDIIKREEKAAKALTTAPGPGEPARYFYPDTNLPYIHTHKLEPWIWVAKDGTCWLFEAPLAAGWKLQDNDRMGPLQVSPIGRDKRAVEAQRRQPVKLGKQPSNEAIQVEVFRIEAREERKRAEQNAANVANKTIGRKLKKKLGHQAGDVLPDGTMVADPANALLELHDQANPLPLKVEAVPPGKTIEQLLPAAKWVPPVSAANLTELAKPFGADRRAREVVKKRFTSLYGKLSKMDAAERAAFLSYVNAKLQ